MKKFVAAALAAVAASSPAVARDNQGYFGVEGGALWARDIDIDAFAVQEGTPVAIDDAFRVDFKTGLDVDLIAGYDLGFIRAEAELGYKRAAVDEVGGPFFNEGGSFVDGDGHVNVTSIMGNALLDFGNEDGVSFYAGGGLGWARVKLDDVEGGFSTISGKDSGLAWQVIAGLRTALSDNIDAGLKYRYFRSSKLDFGDLLPPSSFDEFTAGRFQSHSLLASLIFNFGRAAPPPPPPVVVDAPPPPPPATQTCPDGSVILATDMCPLPPPPPPSPPPEPERG